MQLTEGAVIELSKKCTYSDEEMKPYVRAAFSKDDPESAKECFPPGGKIIEGIVRNFVFDPVRVEANKASIRELLDELHDQYKDGYTFLALCEDKHGRQWTGLHRVMENLVVLGIAAGMVDWCAPRLMWPALPGGMPYVQVK